MKKIRIDQYLVENGYFESRENAKRHIMAKQVLVNEEPIIKPGEMINPDKIKDVRVKNACPYVSRAGLKLAAAVKEFNIQFSDKVMLDVGSSTGGFCDYALQNGIKQVVALDVGTNQLAYKIRINPKVKVCEQTNFRTIDKDFFEDKFDIITMDVSFISSLLLVDNVYQFLEDDGLFILLIKPQFEADQSIKRNKKGVIVDSKVNEQVKDNVILAIKEHNFKCLGVIPSPIKGGNGNQEFIALFKKAQ